MKLCILFIAILPFALGQWMACGKSKYPDAGNMPLPEARIVGGINARRHEFPWQVSIKADQNQFCGGTIINQNWVLSAAHCFQNKFMKRYTKVVTGEHLLNEVEPSEKVYEVEKIVNHHMYYYPKDYSHDFSLLKIKGGIELSENVVPACPPEKNNDYAHVKAITSGWGTTSAGGQSSNELKYTSINTTSNNYCNKRYLNRISKDMICASDNKDSSERDACQGDSGGPLVTERADGKFAVIGVVSWGFGCASGFPGVYSRVPYVMDWIKDTIKN